MTAAMLACASISATTWAKDPKPPAVRAEPLGQATDWIRGEDYPVAAISDGIKGITAITFDVDVDGRVPTCVISTSSGSDVLDETACALIRQRARFSPARDKKGQLVPDRFMRRVVWKIPNMTPSTLDGHQKVTIVYDVDEEGHVEDCRVVTNEASNWAKDKMPPPDFCERTMRSKRLLPVVDKDGNAVRARLTFHTETTISPRPPE